MVKINGIFSTGSIKQTTNGTKYLNISNMEKDQKGNVSYTYYTVWLNDKASKAFPSDIKRKIANNSHGALVEIEGYLKVGRHGNYTNLTIIPLEVKEYKKR
jgi:hypothetical protein